jgi:PAS domain S-box-containing protein
VSGEAGGDPQESAGAGDVAGNAAAVSPASAGDLAGNAAAVSPASADAAPLRILCLEDMPLDAELVCNTLTRAGLALDADVVATRDDFVAALDTGAYDIILADYKLPGFDAHEALRLAQERRPGVPVIVVSGTVGEETAVELLKQGATDYVIKDRLERLPSAVRRALAEAAQRLARLQAEEAARENAANYQNLFHATLSGTAHCEILLDEQGRPVDYRFLQVNDAFEDQTGLRKEEVEGRTIREIIPGFEKSAFDFISVHGKVALTGEEVRFEQYQEHLQRWYSVHVFSPRRGQFISMFSDITERKRAAQALRESEERYRQVSEVISDIAYSCILTEPDGYAIDWIAGATVQVVGYSRDEIQALRCWRQLVVEEDLGIFDEHVVGLAPGRAASCQLRVRHKDGSVRWLASSARCTLSTDAPPVSRLHGGLVDITASKQAEEALAAGARRLRATLHDTVRAMGAIIDLRDRYTGDHQRRVARLAEAIAARLGLDAGRREGLQLAAEVHDVGKIGVPAEILSKPTTLSEVELSLVRQHADIGRQILSTVTFDWPVAEIVGQHHERLDGSGYPDGLRDEEILLEARILAVADVVEAMASHRPYRPALGIDAALAEVREGADRRYDTEVVAACAQLIAAGFALDE